MVWCSGWCVMGVELVMWALYVIEGDIWGEVLLLCDDLCAWFGDDVHEGVVWRVGICLLGGYSVVTHGAGCALD